MKFWERYGFSKFSPERLKESAEEVLGKELELSERGAVLESEIRKHNVTVKTEDETRNLETKVKDAQHKSEIVVLEIEHETDKRKSLSALEAEKDQLTAEAELKDTVHEDEKTHSEAMATANIALESVKNSTVVATVKKESVDAQIGERKLTLGYVQENIDSLLKQKDGVIAGLNMANEVLVKQLEYMQNVLAVAVGKIPTVNLNDFRINVEMPPTTPAKGGGDKSGQSGEKKPN